MSKYTFCIKYFFSQNSTQNEKKLQVKSFIEGQNTHFVSNTFSKNCAVYEIITNNMLVPWYGGNPIRFACHVIKTKIHGVIIFNTHCF
jgi:hypothetical protein